MPSRPMAGTPSKAPILRLRYSRLSSLRPRTRSRMLTCGPVEVFRVRPHQAGNAIQSRRFAGAERERGRVGLPCAIGPLEPGGAPGSFIAHVLVGEPVQPRSGRGRLSRECAIAPSPDRRTRWRSRGRRTARSRRESSAPRTASPPTPRRAAGCRGRCS